MLKDWIKYLESELISKLVTFERHRVIYFNKKAEKNGRDVFLTIFAVENHCLGYGGY